MEKILKKRVGYSQYSQIGSDPDAKDETSCDYFKTTTLYLELTFTFNKNYPSILIFHFIYLMGSVLCRTIISANNSLALTRVANYIIFPTGHQTSSYFFQVQYW